MSIKTRKRLTTKRGMPLTRRHFVQASAALVSMPFSHKMHRPILIKAYLIANIDEKPCYCRRNMQHL